MKEPEPGGPEWRQRYEALRAHVTGEARLAAAPLELALVLQRGVAAWMAAHRSAPGAEPSSVAAPTRSAAARSGMGLEVVQGELVRVLAAAALTVAERRSS